MQVSKRLFNLETETAFTVLAKANKLKSEGKDIINLGIGQPDFPTPKNIVEAAIKALSPAEYAATTRAKRKGTRKGKQHVKQPKKIAKKTRRYR